MTNKQAISAALVAAVSGLAVNAASAGIIRVAETDFTADAGLITFSEYDLGTSNPMYEPAAYGGGAGAPTVWLDGYFDGQSLSGDPGTDCPGAAASACVVGDPTGPLSLDSASPDTFIALDGANPTAPVLSGTPYGNGPIAVLFSEDLAGVGFDAGHFDAVGSTGITAFARDGSLLGTVVNEGLGIEFLGLVTDDGSEQIAGVFLDLVGSEPAGFAIDNLRFGRAGQVSVPGMKPPGGGGDGVQVPEPMSLSLLGAGLFGFAALRRRRRLV